MYVYGGPGSHRSGRLGRDALPLAPGARPAGLHRGEHRPTAAPARASAFKKITYLNLGEYESNDQIAGARYLASLPYVDASRIGIWGWSYGGYMTALTMARGGELFRAGISVAPVTDWRLYDTIYTERFMRTPQENPEGYRKGPPITHVEGSKRRSS